MEKEANKENALRLLVQERRLIAERIKLLQADLEAIQRAEEILSQNSKETPHSSGMLEKVATDYEKLTLQQAILKLMTERPSKSWKPAELAEQLLKEGFKTSSKSPKYFLPTAYSSLKRLLEKGEVEEVKPKRGKRPSYKIKEKTANTA
jgi:hypothetical protein